MKVIAQSLVPTSPLPYMHLGYIAAAAFNATRSYWALSLLFTVLIFYIWKRSRFAAIGFLVLAVATFCWSSVVYHQAELANAPRMTKANASIIFPKITQQVTESKGAPVDIGKAMATIERKWQVDGWKHPYYYDERMEKRIFHFQNREEGKLLPVKIITLISGGPDEIFGTDDDIVQEQKMVMEEPDAWVPYQDQ